MSLSNDKTTIEKITTQAKASRPKYLDIHDHLVQQVQTGVLLPNAPLPKERDLAVSLDVAVGTLRRALRGMENDGVIRRIRGKGTFVNSPRQRREKVKACMFSLIVPLLREDPINALIEGIESASSDMDHRVLVGSSNNEVSKQRKLIQHGVEDQVAGVVIVPTTFPPTPPEDLLLLRENHIPFVYCHRVVEGVEAPLVTWPHIDVGRMAAREFVKQGHERIVAWTDFTDAFIETVGAGIRQVLHENNIDASNYRLHLFGELMRGPSVRDRVRAGLKSLLEAEDRPTAILCFNSFDAEQVYLLAGELGFNIPGNLSLIYFGSNPRESALSQRFTCVGAPFAKIGLEAIQILDAMSSDRMPHDSNHKVEASLELLPGQTLGPVPNY